MEHQYRPIDKVWESENPRCAAATKAYREMPAQEKYDMDMRVNIRVHVKLLRQIMRNLPIVDEQEAQRLGITWG